MEPVSHPLLELGIVAPAPAFSHAGSLGSTNVAVEREGGAGIGRWHVFRPRRMGEQTHETGGPGTPSLQLTSSASVRMPITPAWAAGGDNAAGRRDRNRREETQSDKTAHSKLLFRQVARFQLRAGVSDPG